MKTYSHSPHPVVHPSPSDPPPESSLAALRQAIAKLFSEARSQAAEHQLCPQCSQPMKLVQTIFYLYGTEERWIVRLPVCSCHDEKDALLRDMSSVNRRAD
jgi:hypothetical protein